MATTRKPNGPLRTLIAFAVLVFALTGLLAGAHWNGTASLAPKLGLDLEGGTQMVLTPRLVGDQKVTTEQVNQIPRSGSCRYVRSRRRGTAM